MRHHIQIAFVVIVLLAGLFSARTTSAVSLTGVPSYACVGTTYTIGLTGCSNIKVASSSDWDISATPSAITYNTGSNGGINSITVRWDYATSVTIIVAYCCNNGSGPCNEVSGGLTTHSQITPSVSLSLSSASVCTGTSVTLTATPTNPGTNPSYTFYVDGSVVSVQWPGNGSPVSYTYTTSGVSLGSHSTSVSMSNTTDCVTAVVVTSSSSFTIYGTSSTGSISTSGDVCSSGTTTVYASALIGTSVQWQYAYSDNGGTSYSGWTTYSTATTSPQSMSVSSTSVDRIYLFRVVSQNGSCSAVTSAAQMVTVNSNNTGSLGTSTFIETYGIASGALSVSGYTGVFQQWQQWQQPPNGTGSWTAADTPNSASTYSYTNKPTGDLYYRGLITNGVCVNTPTPVIHLAVYDAPGINASGSTITKFELALGNTVTLQSKYTHYQYKWYRNDTLMATTSSFLVDRPARYKLSVQANAAAPWSTTGDLFITPLGLQTSVSNNISVSTVIRKAGVKPTTNLYTSSLQPTDYRQAISYSDALGQPLQSIAVGQSPAAKDIVQPFAYDTITSITHMPYVSGYRDGQVRDSALTAHLNGKKNYMGSEHRNFYIQASAKIDTSTFAYARDSMENSPLRRVIRHGAPGKDFQIRNSSHYVKPEFHTNVAGDVRTWSFNGTSNRYEPSGSYYAANTLAVSWVTDQNGNIVKTFTDKLGRTILKRVQADGSTWHETYYVYDTRGNLVMQVPPKASASAASWTNSIRDQYCFQYTYDVRNRLVEKLVPGAPAPVYYVYDPLGRLILTQDGNLRASKKWAFIKYDIKGRPVMTGLYTNTTYTTRSTVQANIADTLYTHSNPWYEERGTTLHGYTNKSFPKANAPSGSIDVLTVAYYDNYDFDYNGKADTAYVAQGILGEQSQGNSFGLPTGSKRVILGTSTWLYNYQFYDRFGRPIQTRSNNHLSSAISNLTTVGYDFEGKVLQTKTRHYGSGTSKTLTLTRNEYDFAGRLIRVYHSTDSAQEIVASYYKYNELGQVVEKNLHCTNCNDAVAGQTTTQSSGTISRSTYSTSEQTLVATQQVSLTPGYDTGTGGPLDAYMTGFTASVPGGGTGGTFMQSVDYRYHLRGWLKSINNSQLSDDSGASNDDTGDYFGMETHYNTDAGNSNTKLYNGNITAVKWKSYGYASGTADQRSYKFAYDKAERLLSATSAVVASGVATNDQSGSLDEAVTYDVNGNIQSLIRKQNLRTSSAQTYSNSAQTIDNLTYTYTSSSGNRLTKVDDAITSPVGFINAVSDTAEYKYDVLGNLNVDRNKGIDKIAYNVLGKPDTVHFSDNHWIRYIYDASGTKLTVKNYNTSGTLTTTTDYVGGFVYTNSSLSFFSSPEGRVVKNGSKYEYQYVITDHQGNTRILFTSAAQAALSYKATFEDTTQTAEAATFQNYPTGAKRNATDLWDHTDDGSTYTRSNLLNGGYDGQVGIAKTFKVYPGDKVSIKAFGKYLSGTGSSNVTAFATAILSAFGLSAPGGGEVGTASAGVNNWGSIVAAGNGKANPGYPKAFVNLLVFDKSYNYLDLAADGINGGQQIGVSPDVPHDSLYTEYIIKEEGYVFAYVSNENPTLVDVYFDDVTMTYTPGKILQHNEYYPFGMQTASSWTRDNANNNFLGNGGTEMNPTTQVFDLDYRNYDPILGRMNQVDPMSDKFGSLTPYNYSFNSPVIFNDASGAVPAVWSADIEENATGEFVKRGEYMSFLRASAMVTGGGSGGATWDSYVGHYNLDDAGYGMGSLYFEGQALLSAMKGASNASKWVKDNFNIDLKPGQVFTQDKRSTSEVGRVSYSIGSINHVYIWYGSISRSISTQTKSPNFVDGMLFNASNPFYYSSAAYFKYNLNTNEGTLLLFLKNGLELTTLDKNGNMKSTMLKSLPSDLNVDYYLSDKGFWQLPLSSAESSIMESLGNYATDFWNLLVVGNGQFLTNKLMQAAWENLNDHPHNDIIFRFKTDLKLENQDFHLVLNINY